MRRFLGKGYRQEGVLKKKKGREGPLGKSSLYSTSRCLEQRRGQGGGGGHGPAAPGARRRPGRGGKARGGQGGSIPLLTMC